MEPEELNIINICNGAVPDLFERELKEVYKNIQDVNTPYEKARKIIFEFTFEPFDDRSGAMVHFSCKSRSVPVEEKSGRSFIQRRGGNVLAFPHDPQQARLFNPPETKEDDEEKLH